jgi:hypothetical protein
MTTNAATMQHQKTLEKALAYADQGLPVFPCDADKRPMVKGGFKAATTDKDAIQRMWDERGDVPCVGVSTGKASGIFVLDVDTDEGKRGDESLKSLEDAYEPLPETPTFRTGGGGRQHIFRYPEGVEIRNSAGKLGEGLDVRGEGGYTILPPSVSVKGKYVGENEGGPTDPPEWLVELLLKDKQSGKKSGGNGKKGGDHSSLDEDGDLIIPDGARDDTLFKEASRLRALGYPIEAAIGALGVLDDECAEYPGGKDHTDRSVEEIVESVYNRYAPGEFRVPWSDGDGVLPFPIDAMPVKTQEFIRQTARALDCPMDLVGLPVLGSLSAAIGNSRRAKVKRRYHVSTTLYLAVISPPGSGKSPAGSAATRLVKERQEKLGKVYEEQKREYDRKKRKYDALKKEDRAKVDLPQKPLFPRTWVDDFTVESLAPRLRDNPHGLYLIQDELAGWVASFNQYKGGKGNDRQKYLQMWNNETISVDRKSSDEPEIVPRPFITIFGGIQPGRLGVLADNRGDGFFDRFLVAYPKDHIARPGAEETSPEAEKSYHGLIRSLYDLEPEEDGTPIMVPFTRDAFDKFQLYCNRLADEQEFGGHPDALKDHLSKLKEYLARIALILATCRTQKSRVAVSKGSLADTSDTTNTFSNVWAIREKVLPEDVEKAWNLVEYFKSHLYRVYKHTNTYDTKAKVTSELVSYLSNYKNGEWVGKSASEWGKVLPSAPDNANSIAHLLKEIAEEQENITLERGYQGNGRTIKIKLDRGVGSVGGVGEDSTYSHPPTTEGHE